MGPDTFATKPVFEVYILFQKMCQLFFSKNGNTNEKNYTPFKNFTLKLSVFTFSSLLPPSLLPPFFVQMERI